MILYLTEWLARDNAGSGICLIATSDDADDWRVWCGGGGALEAGGPSGSYAVRPDDSPTPEGATALSENIYLLE